MDEIQKMQKTRKRFKSLGPNTWAPVVDPKTGEIMHVRYAENIGGSIVELRAGKPRVADTYADQGFKFLADYYANDADPEIRASGFGHYMDYQRAVETRQAPREQLPDNGRSTIRRFPVDWLPSAVVAMQSGEALGQWAPPERSVSVEKKAKPKAKPVGKA